MTTYFIGNSYIKSIEKMDNTKVYSLVEGQINGSNTYFLISVDSSNIENNPLYIIIDPSALCDSTCDKEKYKISLNGLTLGYETKVEDLKPVIEEIKESTGYQLSGIIGNQPLDNDTVK